MKQHYFATHSLRVFDRRTEISGKVELRHAIFRFCNRLIPICRSPLTYANITNGNQTRAILVVETH